jgi:hypothetical protein
MIFYILQDWTYSLALPQQVNYVAGTVLLLSRVNASMAPFLDAQCTMGSYCNSEAFTGQTE